MADKIKRSQEVVYRINGKGEQAVTLEEFNIELESNLATVREGFIFVNSRIVGTYRIQF